MSHVMSTRAEYINRAKLRKLLVGFAYGRFYHSFYYKGSYFECTGGEKGSKLRIIFKINRNLEACYKLELSMAISPTANMRRGQKTIF